MIGRNGKDYAPADPPPPSAEAVIRQGRMYCCLGMALNGTHDPTCQSLPTPYCPRCDRDEHVCPGCGEPATHDHPICPKCEGDSVDE